MARSPPVELRRPTFSFTPLFRRKLPCVVLAGQYHPPGFSQWSRPEWVIISGGHSPDRADGVTKAYASRGATVLYTAYDGAVRFLVDAGGVQAACWREGRWVEE